MDMRVTPPNIESDATSSRSDAYGITAWGLDYFAVNAAGNLVVRPTGDPGREIDLKQLVDDLRQRDVCAPMVLRFTDLLEHRLGQVAGAFRHAIEDLGYTASYRGVYPIKVNQQRHLVEDVLRVGRQYGFGFEVGSKPELLAILALVDDADTPIVCNGFKDEPFLEAVVLASKLGRNVIPVIEKFGELRTLIAMARRHDCCPKIGIRVKLAAAGAGRWEESGGSRSKFGLFVSEVVEAVNYLRTEGLLDRLALLHTHMGSQVNHVRSIKASVRELARVYASLYQMGAAVEYLDLGGGLGVDYDGSRTPTESSTNYDLQEYANNIVFHVMEAADDAGVPHPVLMTESGRAMVAHHCVLVFDILGWSGFDRFEVPDDLSADDLAALPNPVRTLYESYHNLKSENFAEYYHDSLLNRDETMQLFNLGHCSLEHRSLAERLFFGVCAKVLREVRSMSPVPDEFAGLESMLADIYFANLSIFQSLPDSWAIGQLFPVVPIHRLNEEPTARGILADITCDSDGRIDQFPTTDGPVNVLKLHPYTGGEYLLGAFLVGAYQETLGGMHNLFGDTHAVHVRLGESGQPVIHEIVEGDTTSEVLGYVQYDVPELRRRFRQSIETAINDQRLTLDQARTLRRFYEQGLMGYTYLQ